MNRSLLARTPLVALALSTIVAASTAALANDGAFYGTGATVFPVKDDAIALDTEDLRITQAGPTAGYYVDHWRVEVVYGFRNTTDKAVEVQMGFPEWCVQTPDNYEELPEKCTEWTIEDFTIDIDGQEKSATIKRAKKGQGRLAELEYHRVHTFTVKFAPNQRRTIRHTYRHRGGITSPDCSDMTYILKTGSLWAGKIGTLDIRAEVIEQFDRIENYDGWLKGEDGLPKPRITKTEAGQVMEWSLRDHEPTKDLSILFCGMAGNQRSEVIGDVTAVTDDELRKMSRKQLRLLRNTIYAAYGYRFKSTDLQAHFDKQKWYRARADYDASWLSSYHREQVARIKRIEAEKKKAGK